MLKDIIFTKSGPSPNKKFLGKSLHHYISMIQVILYFI